MAAALPWLTGHYGSLPWRSLSFPMNYAVPVQHAMVQSDRAPDQKAEQAEDTNQGDALGVHIMIMSVVHGHWSFVATPIDWWTLPLHAIVARSGECRYCVALSMHFFFREGKLDLVDSMTW